MKIRKFRNENVFRIVANRLCMRRGSGFRVELAFEPPSHQRLTQNDEINSPNEDDDQVVKKKKSSRAAWLT